jgi:hypothetical protein
MKVRAMKAKATPKNAVHTKDILASFCLSVFIAYAVIILHTIKPKPHIINKK